MSHFSADSSSNLWIFTKFIDKLHEINLILMLKKLLLLSFICLTEGIVQAQDAQIFKPDSVQRELKATRITTHLKVDGKLDETEWKQVRSYSDFVQIEPFQGEKPSQHTFGQTIH